MKQTYSINQEKYINEQTNLALHWNAHILLEDCYSITKNNPMANKNDFYLNFCLKVSIVNKSITLGEVLFKSVYI